MTGIRRTQSSRPGRPVVVYDGHCPFCLRQIQRIRRGDTAGVFDYLPRQTEGLEQRFPKLMDGNFNTGMRLVHTNGSVSAGADAVYQIARQIKGWKQLAWLYRVPVLHGVFRAAYAWVAKYRYKLAKRCENDICEI